MKPEQLEKILQSIDTRLETGIEKNVNGKIRILTEEVRNHFIEDRGWKDNYKRADDEWKEKADAWMADASPSIKIMKKAENFSETGVFLLKTIIIIGGALGAIYGLLRWIRG